MIIILGAGDSIRLVKLESPTSSIIESIALMGEFAEEPESYITFQGLHSRYSMTLPVAMLVSLKYP